MCTLGLMTKPYTPEASSDSETSYLKPAQNKDIFFLFGCVRPKNCSYEVRDASSAECDEAEGRSFATRNLGVRSTT